jgi:hypothetical protein
VNALNAAQYEKALQLAADGVANHPEISQIQQISAQLHQNFTPGFDLHCRKHGKPLGAASGGNDCQTLTPADEFNVQVNLPDTSSLPEDTRRYYAYLYLVDSKGDWKVLLPNKTDVNPLFPSVYKAPDEYQMLHPPVTPGTEKLYLVVAWWRIPALEDLSAKLMSETDPGRLHELGSQLDARLHLEQAKPVALKGLKTGWLEFTDSGTQ